MCPPLRRDENLPAFDPNAFPGAAYLQPLEDLVGFPNTGFVFRDEAEVFAELGVAFLEASNRLRSGEESPGEIPLPPTQPVTPSPTVSPLSQELRRPHSQPPPVITPPEPAALESPSPPLIYDPHTRSYVQTGSPNIQISPSLRRAIYEHVFGRSPTPDSPKTHETPETPSTPDYSPVRKQRRLDSDDESDEPRRNLVPRRLSFSD